MVSGLTLMACVGLGEDADPDGAGGGTSAQADDDPSSTDSSGGAGTADQQSPPTEVPDPIEFDPIFADGSCPSGLPLQLEPRCGTVEVPMDWSTGEGTVILPVAVFPSTAAEPAADPVVYLEGGPGGHALETLAFSTEDLLLPLLARSDVVVFDQRGAGLAEPALACPEVTEATRQLEDIPIISDAEAKRRYYDALGACRNRLGSSDIDLADFNSFNNAHDTDAIRRALDYPEWNLFGVSYGTKLGLESMRRHPDGIRAVVLDSVYPPEVDSVAENPVTFTESYERVARACRAEAACDSQGDLMERFEDLVHDLQINPVRVEITDFVSGEEDEMYLTGDVLIGIVVQALYSPDWFTDLPELATDLEAGGLRVVEQFLSQQRTSERFVSEGMFYAFSCREEISFSDPATVVDPPDPFGLRDTFDLASNTGTNAFASCAVFDNGQAAAEANEPVVSDIPTLLLAGAFDPVTPVSWAERAAGGLSDSHLVVAPSASHGVFATPCGMSVVVAFIDDPASAPDSSCLAAERLQFVGPSPETIEVVAAEYVVEPWGAAVTTVRPEGWTTGSLSGDQYRQQSFLDPTQLFQLAGDSSLGQNLAQFIEQQWNLTLSPTAPFTGSSTAGALRPSELDSQWSRRTGSGAGVAVEWFETEVDADSGIVAYVILVSSTAEQLALVDQVLAPALRAITIET